jgi:hypothetical protein
MQLVGSQQQSLQQRQELKSLNEQLHEARSQLQNISGKITSLELLQQHAMGKDKKKLTCLVRTVGLAETAAFSGIFAGGKRLGTGGGSGFNRFFRGGLFNDCQSFKGLAVVDIVKK